MDIHENAQTTPRSRAVIAERVSRGQPVRATGHRLSILPPGSRRHQA